MSYVVDLLDAYRRFVNLPWPRSVAPPQRVWMAVYPPKYERRVRLNLPEFENATVQAGHAWACIDVTTSFERWMAGHEYAGAYFEEPELLEDGASSLLRRHWWKKCESSSRNTRIRTASSALIGAGTLFGLGDAVKVSALVAAVNASIAGRLLVFFPGRHEHNTYRLLDARDGWDYLATPITTEGATR